MLRKLKHKNLSFYYHLYKSKDKKHKETLVFLHGFLEDSSMWDKIISHFNNFDIITLDLLGHGRSSVFSEKASILDMAKLVNSVLELESINSIGIVGHSMGGYVALELATLYKGNITNLILYHSSVFSDSELKKQDRLRAVKAVEYNHSLFIKNAIPNLFSESSLKKNKLAIDQLTSIALNTPLKGVTAALLAMKDRKDFSSLIPNIKANVILLAGDNDPIMPIVKIQNHFGLDNLTYEIMEGVGHMSYIENIKLTIKTLYKYILTNNENYTND